MTREEFNRLYEKYNSGQCSRQEQKQLETYKDSFLPEGLEWDADHLGDPESLKHSIQCELNNSIERQARRQKMTINWYSAAAVILVILTFGLYFNKKTVEPAAVYSISPRFKNDVLPGNNKAVLILDDGSQIDLNNAKDGLLASESNIDIEKVGLGQLKYKAGNRPVQAVKFNTLSTPMGGQYSLVLPDGSKVWLNSGSSLRFPTAFSGSDRIVELKGEAYFEITPNKQMPFRVRTNNSMEVKVLGTHFNVMAYENEKSISTTLIEGSVQVFTGSGKVQINPGQAAVLTKGSGNVTISSADTEQVIAWKNGYFIFSNENIESIMRKVSRWYDVDIIYQGNLNNKDFVGTISRNKNISELLKMLELTGAVHFTIEGRRITVMP